MPLVVDFLSLLHSSLSTTAPPAVSGCRQVRKPGLELREILTSLARSMLEGTIHQPCDKSGRGEIATQHFKSQVLSSPLVNAKLFLHPKAFSHKNKWVIRREVSQEIRHGTGSTMEFLPLLQG
uniref:Uncharacterized protein n=1 Tax=Molossus molossus TaxID=27622 RepID=A0A7J8DBP8_MOLMO|nr:hypothetical protein HJG59_009339 [Molossus molossus]